MDLGAPVLIPVEAIEIPPDRIRTDLGDIEQLAADIKETGGVMQPIIVQTDESGITLLDGERRLTAHKLAGIDEILCRPVKNADPDLIEAYGNHYKPYTAEEIGRFSVKHWNSDWVKSQGGAKRDAIGKRLGVSGPQIDRCRKLVLSGDKDIIDKANKEGAKAAERDLNDKLGKSLPRPLSTAALYGVRPFDLIGSVGNPNLIVAYLSNPLYAGEVIDLAQSDLCSDGVLLIGAPFQAWPVLQDEIIRARATRAMGLGLSGRIVVVAKSEYRLYDLYTRFVQEKDDVRAFHAKDMKTAVAQMVQAFCPPEGSIVDPWAAGGLHAWGSTGRHLTVADMDTEKLGLAMQEAGL